MKLGVTKRGFLAACLISIISFSVGIYVKNEYYANVRASRWTANVYVFVEKFEGKAQLKVSNLITNIGERYVRNILGFDNVTNHNATKWISLSNDASPLATWTKLPNEITTSGFERAEGTVVAWISSGDYAYNVSNKFTASVQVTAQCAGANWNDVGDTDNNLYAAAAFTQETFDPNENCTIIWMFVQNAN